ncbi:hypothetical protein OG978_06955 [Streptomyces sp. NBC_01591]|uniref:hypothetical protein n=1 Tax=Streptomyces sp. NBC_01591 TaxID=2975888 RepID=UPI002DDA532A|nr:hypothetical protein [Streptomyces sp. NBC_01591]WSD67144.1 hypothetical protein OG978_06955 [Streptomyces sp. NBC_01591]
MTALVDEHPGLGVECVLRELSIASSTYYRWRRAEREPCDRVRQDAELTEHLAQNDGDGVWGLTEQLQALTIDELRIANWQRENEGRKASQQTRRPTPIQRPGQAPRRDKNSPERTSKRMAAKQRAAERRRAIARGEIT